MGAALVGILGLLPQLLLYVVFIVVVAVWSRGRVRTYALVAGAVWLVGAVLNAAYNLLLPRLVAELEVNFQVLGLVSAGFVVFSYVSLGFIAAALIVGSRALARQQSGPGTGYQG